MEGSKLKDLIKRYLNGEASSAERYTVDCWFDSFQQDQDSHPILQNPAELAAFQQHIITKGPLADKLPAAWHKRSWAKWVAAALLLCFTSVFLKLYISQHKADVTNHKNQVVSTGIGQLKRLMLPDSTVIYLNANTSLEVSAEFGVDERAVRLTGEAFFEVKRDTLHPFKVYTNGLEVQVLGTKFNINAYDKLTDIYVAVSSGKVQVSNRKKVLTFLQTDQQLVYNKQTATYHQSGVESASQSSWRSGTSILSSAGFETLAQVMYNQYGIGLKSSDKQVLETAYNFTVRSSRRLDQTMEQLCQMLKKKYRKEGDRIIIY